MRHRPVSNPEAVFATLVEKIESGEEITHALLEEAGVTPENLPAVERITRDRALTLAAEYLRHVLLSLDGTSACVALQRILLGEDGSGKRLKVSRQAINQAEGRIKKRIAHLTR